MDPKLNPHHADRSGDRGDAGADHEPLAAALARLRRDLATAEPPALPALSVTALQARRAVPADANAPAPRPVTAPPVASAPRRWAWLGSALAGAALSASVLLMLQAPPPERPPAWADVRSAGFVPLLPPERWPDGAEPAAAAWIVPAELSGERLALLGLPFDPGPAAAPVPAELLVHASGEVLAVRLLR